MIEGMGSLPKPTDGFDWVQAAPGPALVCRALEPHAAHLFTSRGWPLGTAASDGRDAAWADVARAIGVEPARLVRAHQVHGTAVIVRRRNEFAAREAIAGPLPPADIIIADDPSIALAVQTADCVPLLIADRRTGAVAAAHAGWRGLAGGVPGVAVRAMADAFDSRPEDLVAAIGPSIGAPQYEVDAAVRDAFVAAGFDGAQLGAWFLDGVRAAHWQFDGWAAARDQLGAAGVPAAQIHGAALCTASYRDVLCSYRRDGRPAGRMAGVIRARR
jgi:purine-nucleoside/S-methyl-5'-thioadenosine phosphorylase / adenosine deaminase